MDVSKIKQRQALAGGDRWKLKDGPNNVRLFYFRHKVTEADVKGGLYPREKLGKVEIELDRPVVVQFGIVEGIKGPVRSTPALVEKFEKIKAAKGDKIAGKCAPSSMFAVNLVDTDEKPRRMRQVLLNRSTYNAILRYIANKDYELDGVMGGKLQGVKGRDFVITYDPNAAGAAKYTAAPRDKEFSVVLNGELEKLVKDFMSPAGYATLGIKEAPGEEVAEESTEEAPADEETPAEEDHDAHSGTKEEAAAEEETPAEEEAPADEEEEAPAKESTKRTKAPAKPAKKGGKPARRESSDD